MQDMDPYGRIVAPSVDETSQGHMRGCMMEDSLAQALSNLEPRKARVMNYLYGLDQSNLRISEVHLERPILSES